MIDLQDVKLINKGSVLASFNVHIPNWKMTIRECTMFEKDTKRWVSMPSRKYEHEGKTKYHHFIRFDNEEVSNRFQDAIKKKFDEWMNSQVPKVEKSEEIPF